MTALKLIRMISAADLDDIATGGAILGTGGGGDPYVGKLMAQEAIRRHGAVRLVDVEGFADDALIAPVCMMGAPTVMTEKLPQGAEIVIALRKLERFMGRKVDGLLCGEAGGINSTTPFVAAAATGLPPIDGGGMGRAFPELQMTTFGMHGVSATPMALGDGKGNSVILETISNRWTERLARSATVDMGGSALLAFYPMTGAVAREAIVRGTLSLRADLGRNLREARLRHDDPIEAVRAALNAEIIFNDRVKDVLRRTVGGFARGEAEVEGLDRDRGHKLRIAFQNEFVIAERDGKTMVTTPDMITLLEAEPERPSPPTECDTASGSSHSPTLPRRNGARPKGSSWSAALLRLRPGFSAVHPGRSVTAAPMRPTAQKSADQFTFSVIQEAIAAAADEMFAVLRKTAMSPIIYEVLDFGAGVTDSNGNLLSSGAGVPGFIGAIDKAVKRLIELI